MNPQEILPSPETERPIETGENPETVNEAQAATKLEQKNGMSSGFGAVPATAVDDAQSQLQGVMTATATDDDDDDVLATVSMPANAEDLDLIEKEWVQKAKDIVQATHGDPYRQNQRINHMKAEYIKKRYNKEIKYREE